MSQCGILIHSIVTYAEAVIKSFLIEWTYISFVARTVDGHKCIFYVLINRCWH